MRWAGRIFQDFKARCQRAIEREGHVSLLGENTITMQKQNDHFSRLSKRYLSDIEFNLLLGGLANTRAMIFVNAVASIGMALYLYPQDPLFAIGWLGCVMVFSIIRRANWQQCFQVISKEVESETGGTLQDSAAREDFIRKWRQMYLLGLVVAGSFWILILERSIAAGSSAKYFACIVIAAMAGGATGLCAPMKNEGRIYITTLLIPSALVLAFAHESDPILGGLAVLCWSTLRFGLLTNYRAHRQALELQAANNGLVNDLRDLNHSLEKKVEKRTRDLEYAAMRDPLTDLPNRRGFREVMDRLVKKSSPFTVGVVDLDGFKAVNDAFGHAVGDELLKAVGARLKERVGSAFQVARLGGDEFGFILKSVTGESEVEVFGNALVEHLSVPYRLTGVVAEIGASVGLCRFPLDGETPELLCQRADYALYFAKQFRKGKAILFEAEHEAEICQLARIEQFLRQADLDTELAVQFQPIKDIRAGRTHTFESLARWNSPELGNVPPDLFIQAAERSGFIVELTPRLVRHTLRHAANWPKHMRVSINLSARDIAAMDTVDALIDIVRQSMVDPRRIDFEITETALVCDFDQARTALTKLAELGARISLDDFGTGHSSLSHLQHLPLDKLKIDSSFIQNMETDPTSRNIVRALLLLCRSMKLDCIVEGVETESQMKLVQNMGGRLVQGYHIARPMSAEQTTEYIRTEQQNANQSSLPEPEETRAGWRRRA